MPQPKFVKMDSYYGRQLPYLELADLEIIIAQRTGLERQSLGVFLTPEQALEMAQVLIAQATRAIARLKE